MHKPICNFIEQIAYFSIVVASVGLLGEDNSGQFGQIEVVFSSGK